MEQLKTIIYCRGTKIKPEIVARQQKDCKGFARKLGLSPQKAFIELKETSPIHRPIFQEMINFSRDNKIDFWTIDKTRRIARNKNDLVNTIKILNKNKIVLLAVEKLRYTNNDPPIRKSAMIRKAIVKAVDKSL